MRSMPAMSLLRSTDFDLVGNLDADITLPPDYYEFLLGKFNEMPNLGVAGTPFVEDARQAGHSQLRACAREFGSCVGGLSVF